MSDAFVVHLPPAATSSAAGPPPPGRAAAAAAVQQLRADFPDLRITIEDVVAAGDEVAMRTTWSGTQADDFEAWGAPNTGRPMTREAYVFARVACGKLAELWVLPDNLTMLRQLGIVSDAELATVDTPTVATPAP